MIEHAKLEDKEEIYNLICILENKSINKEHFDCVFENSLKNGDIITSIDNIELNTMNDLREYIYTKKPNDEVNLKIIRGKINKEFNIVLGKK